MGNLEYYFEYYSEYLYYSEYYSEMMLILFQILLQNIIPTVATLEQIPAPLATPKIRNIDNIAETVCIIN